MFSFWILAPLGQRLECQDDEAKNLNLFACSIQHAPSTLTLLHKGGGDKKALLIQGVTGSLTQHVPSTLALLHKGGGNLKSLANQDLQKICGYLSHKRGF